MRLDLSPAVKQARNAALVPLLAGGTVTIYGGTPPSAGGAATTALLSYTLSTPAGVSSGGVFTLTPPSSSNGLADGVATWGRLANSSGSWVIDADAGATGADAFFILDSASVTTGATVALLSLTLSEP